MAWLHDLFTGGIYNFGMPPICGRWSAGRTAVASCSGIRQPASVAADAVAPLKVLVEICVLPVLGLEANTENYGGGMCDGNQVKNSSTHRSMPSCVSSWQVSEFLRAKTGFRLVSRCSDGQAVGNCALLSLLQLG